MRFKTLEFKPRYLITLLRIDSLGEVEGKVKKEEGQECRVLESDSVPLENNGFYSSMKDFDSNELSKFMVCFCLTIYRREREWGQTTTLRMQNTRDKDDTGTDLIFYLSWEIIR